MESDGAGGFTLGDLDSGNLSFTARQLVVFTPHLTLQAYLQLFGEFVSYGPFYAATSSGRAIGPDDMVPIPPASLSYQPDAHGSFLNVNVVLRWEYRTGSVLYAIYTRSQQELPPPPGVRPPSTIAPVMLGPGPAVDTFMLKWTYRVSM